MDYTTIPGMKLKVDRAEDLPAILIDPGENPMLIHLSKGHMHKIQRCKDRFILVCINFRFRTFRQFLEYLYLIYGGLNSFYWGPRYVVAVGDLKYLSELKKYRENLCKFQFSDNLW